MPRLASTARACLAAALLLTLTALPAAAQQEAPPDRADQLRQRREAEMRARVEERRQELQAQIRREAAPPAADGVIEQDSLALVALYKNANGEDWRFNGGWLEAPVADWYGVTVSGDRVVEVSLSDIYNPSSELTGSIPAELGQLDKLQVLILSNQLTGEIPVELSQLSNLKFLDLESNQLTGEIPVELSQLSNLEFLDLGSNQLTGEIPVELSQLSNLEFLDLGSNQLTGEIPVELSQLSNLQSLNLGSNQLTGKIPVEFKNLTAMSESSFGQFYFNETDLCEPPDASFQAWLYSVDDVSSTGVQCGGSSGDGGVADQDSLALAALYDSTDGPNWNNNGGWLEAPVADWYGVNVSGDRVVKVNLDHNELTGEIPPELGNLTDLQVLDLLTN